MVPWIGKDMIKWPPANPFLCDIDIILMFLQNLTCNGVNIPITVITDPSVR